MTSRGENIGKRVGLDRKACGFSCDLWIDPPNQTWENSAHPVDELVMVLQGKLELEIWGRIFYPETEEEVLIPAKATHPVCDIGVATARLYCGYKK